MTSWFAGSSAGKFFGLGAGGVLSSYVTYTRSETHRQRPAESRAARKARGREAVQATPAMFGKAIAVSPGPSIMEAIANAAPPLPSADGAATGAGVAVLFGAATKSAQVPFHMWLPGAMAAPTPVSAYLHSATMVKAGIFLLMRLWPALAGTWTVSIQGS